MPERIFAATLRASVQNGVVNLGAGVLQLARHDIENMVPFSVIRNQQLGVRQPRGDIASVRR